MRRTPLAFGTPHSYSPILMPKLQKLSGNMSHVTCHLFKNVQPFCRNYCTHSTSRGLPAQLAETRSSIQISFLIFRAHDILTKG